MRLLFFLIAFLFTFSSEAQNLRIVKDNVNCSYGLKDQVGNWVIDPVYVLIQEYNVGYFQVKDATGDGLVSPEGKWLIECSYDRLTAASRSWRIVGSNSVEKFKLSKGSSFFLFGYLGDQKFLLNSKGKRLAEITNNDQLVMDGDDHFMINSYRPLTTTYMDTSGRVLIDHLPGIILPFGTNNFSLYGRKTQKNDRISLGETRLINRNGEYPLDATFDRAILVDGKKICFENDQKYGEMKTNGTVLIEPRFRREARLTSSHHSKKTWVIYDENEKAGLMKPDGTILLYPIYDQVALPHWNSEFPRLWLVKKDGLYGVKDDHGKPVLPLSYDEITFVNYFKNENSDGRTNFMVRKDGKYGYINLNKSSAPQKWYDEIKVFYEPQRRSSAQIGVRLITKLNEKYGILHLDGTTQSECIYDGHAVGLSNRKTHFFWKNLEVTTYYFIQGESGSKDWEQYFTSDKVIWYTDSRSFATGKLSESGESLVSLDTRDRRYNIVGNIMIVDQPAHGDWEIYHTKTEEKIEITNVAEIRPFIDNRLMYRTNSNYYGLLNMDGEIVVEAKYLELRQNYQSDYIWAFSGKDESGKDKWNLIDKNGELVFLQTIAKPFRVNAGDILLTENDKKGVFDTKSFTWKIQPIYPCLFKSVGDFYIAAFAENKKGILKSDGTVLLPLEYTSILVLTKNELEPDRRMRKKNPEVTWIVNDGRKDILINEKGSITTSALEIRRLQEALMFSDRINTDGLTLIESNKEKKNTFVPAPPSDELIFMESSFHRASNLSETGVYQNYPELNYSGLIPMNAGAPEEIRLKRQNFWQNAEMKALVFDTINSIWNQERNHCRDRFSRFQISPKPEQNVAREFKEDCRCAQQNHQHRSDYGYNGRYYLLDTIGEHFVSITYGFMPDNDMRYMTMSQSPPPPPPPSHLNFVVRDGKAISLQLKDIFHSDSVLLDEFIIALQKRDDLQLECSSLEIMVQMIGGKFSLSEKGVHLKYSNDYDFWQNEHIEFLIPLEHLKLHEESKWIVPILTEE